MTPSLNQEVWEQSMLPHIICIRERKNLRFLTVNFPEIWWRWSDSEGTSYTVSDSEAPAFNPRAVPSPYWPLLPKGFWEPVGQAAKLGRLWSGQKKDICPELWKDGLRSSDEI